MPVSSTREIRINRVIGEDVDTGYWSALRRVIPTQHYPLSDPFAIDCPANTAFPWTGTSQQSGDCGQPMTNNIAIREQ
jgi:hypothetical protein